MVCYKSKNLVIENIRFDIIGSWFSINRAKEEIVIIYDLNKSMTMT